MPKPEISSPSVLLKLYMSQIMAQPHIVELCAEIEQVITEQFRPDNRCLYLPYPRPFSINEAAALRHYFVKVNWLVTYRPRRWWRSEAYFEIEALSGCTPSD